MAKLGRSPEAKAARLAELNAIARRRGGRCLAAKYVSAYAPLPFECRKGHRWAASSNHILHSGSWCPDCARGRVTSANNLAVTHPQLASQWHATKNTLRASDVLPTSQYRVWWQCGKGHVWRQAVVSRTSVTSKYRGGDCPACGSLAEAAPAIAAEWDAEKNGRVTPFDVRPASNRLAWWRCRRGHAWQAIIGNRFRGAGCPKCSPVASSSRSELRIFCEMASIFSDVRHRSRVNGVEVDIWLPKYRMAIEYDGVRWHAGKQKQDRKKTKLLAECGVKLLRVREHGLPRLRGHCISVPLKELSKRDVEKVLERLFEGGEMPRAAKQYGRLSGWAADAHYRQVIAELPVLPGANLAGTHPDLAAEWSKRNDPLKPTSFTRGSHHRAWWRCPSGHEWQMAIKERTGQEQGCPFCSGRRVSASNSLSARRPDLCAHWDRKRNSLLPEQVSYGSHRKVWWKCRKQGGHSYLMSVKSKVAGQGCAVCSGQQVVPSTSFAAKFPLQAAFWDVDSNGNLKPAEVAPFSVKRVNWKCRCGCKWVTTVSKMAKSTRRCPGCGHLPRSDTERHGKRANAKRKPR